MRSRLFLPVLLLSLCHWCFAADKGLIAILAPMTSEAAAIRPIIKNAVNKPFGQLTITHGDIHHHPVILVVIGMGKISSAVMTARVIEHFHPQQIILAGTAGGLKPDNHFGDIVIASKVIATEYMPIAYQPEPHPLTHTKVPNLFRNLDVPNKSKPMQNKPYRVIIGTIATTDQFPQSAALLKTMQATGSDAVELEGAAVAQVCWMFQQRCTIVRGISSLSTSHPSMHTPQPSDETPATFKLAMQHVADHLQTMIGKG